ncbi:MAG: LamG domain-containing protein, partial [Bacilli bacterium]
AYKTWSFDESNYTSSSLDVCRAVLPRNGEYPGGVLPISSSLAAGEPMNPDGTYQSVVYSSVRHCQYNPYDAEFLSPMGCDLQLHETASVLSMPFLVVGDGVKRGSLSIVDRSTGSPVTLGDDSMGNLVDHALTGSGFAPEPVAYWGFNEKYSLIGSAASDGSASCGPAYHSEHVNQSPLTLAYHDARFEPGVESTGSASLRSGVMTTLTGSGWMEVKHNDMLNFGKDDDFAISMWVDLPTSQSVLDTEYNTLISKTGTEKVLLYNRERNTSIWTDIDTSSSLTPFFIKVYNQTTPDSGKVTAGVHDGMIEYYVTSTSTINGGQHHVLFQHTGSVYQLWIDGALEVAGYPSVHTNLFNKCNVMLGASAKTRENLSGSIDEVRIFDRALTSAQIATLADNDYSTFAAYQTARVGNVFYRTGICVVSDPRPKYRHAMLGQTGTFDYSGGYGFDVFYNSTVTIYENRVLCRVRQDEFNMSLNPTLRTDNRYNSETAKSFVGTEEWHPYVTTIGLYDDLGNLLVVAKLAAPIPKYDTVDTTFLVRWDS